MNYRHFLCAAIAPLMLCAGLSAQAEGSQIFAGRTPYLQNVTPEGVTIMYQTGVLCHSEVEYGTDTTALTTARELIAGQEMVHDIQHKVRLAELTPGAKYYYRVRAREILDNQAYSKTFGDEALTPFYTFTVPQTDGADYTALIVNDLHGCRATIEAMAHLADSIPHDIIIFNGDCLSEPATRQGAIDNLHSLIRAFDLANTPGLFIRGNHEIRNAWSSGAPSLFDRPADKTYGAFTVADIRFVTLDCGEDKPDSTWVYYGLNDFTDLRREEADFIAQELKSKEFKKAKRHILIHHIPIWGNCDKYQPCTEQWSHLFKGAKLDLDIAGHTHSFATHAANTIGNPTLTIVGGAPETDRATMTIIEKHGRDLSAKVLSARGNILAEYNL